MGPEQERTGACGTESPMNSLRVGVAGLIHGHVWGLIDSWAKVEGAELTAVADHTPLLERAKDRFARTYTDWREMLDKETLDALVVTSDNRESAEIAVAALGKGIPCLVEKAMAANVADAERMLEAQRASGKLLVINWPFCWSPWVHELKRQLDSGVIGPVFHFRFRNGHHGPKEIGCDEWFVGWLYDEERNGGGALADFCGYGAVLSRWLFGMPTTVFGVRDTFTKAYDVPDDHAILLARYPKMTAELEGTWATYGFDESANPVVHGRDGTIGVYGNSLRIYRAGREVEVVEAPDLDVRSPAAYFATLLETGGEPEGMLHPLVSADAVRIVEAGRNSAASGCAEPL